MILVYDYQYLDKLVCVYVSYTVHVLLSVFIPNESHLSVVSVKSGSCQSSFIMIVVVCRCMYKIIMYIYHALINALSAHPNMIFHTHVEHSPTKTIHIKCYKNKIKNALQTHTHAHIHTHTDCSSE